MRYLVFEFDSENEMEEVAKKLWDHYNVTGEMGMRRNSSGRWRLEVVSEKDLRESSLEKFAQYRVEVVGD